MSNDSNDETTTARQDAWLNYARDYATKWEATGYGQANLTEAGAYGPWRLELATGGWSGNEEMLDGIAPVFHALFWQSSHRGGQHFYAREPSS